MEACRDFSEALIVNQSLEVLDIGYNNMKDYGLRKIGESLAQNSKSNLKLINFEANSLTDSGLQNFFSTLA